MSEREEHNELIHRLAERLRDHTEPYKDGAWERFAASYGKRRRTLWPYWSAAAVVLAAVGSYWLMRHSAEFPTPPQHVQRDAVVQSVVPPIDEDNEPDETASAATSQVAARPAVLPTTVLPTQATDSGWDHADTEPRSLAVTSEAQHDEVSVEEPQRLAVTEGAEDGSERPMGNALSDLVFNDGRSVDADAYASGTSPKSGGSMEKWDLGLMVSPSLTSEAVNIGGGFTVAYRISDKFSIGSGISIGQMGVGENPDYRPGYSSRQSDYLAAPTGQPGGYPVFNGKSEAALDYKREVSMTSSVVTLDIPLDIRYDVVKGFYTSIGVSYVTVLNEQRTSHYVDKINTNTFANGHSGSADRLAPTEFAYSSEKITAKPLQGNGYAGFMNFSIGKKLPISSKLFLSVEPYFKLPIGRLSKEEMDFTNGGIRIVTGF